MSLLTVKNLSTEFYTSEGIVQAANSVDFRVEEGETVGIVGESGSGKSVTARSIMQLVDSSNATTNGTVEFKGENLHQADRDRIEKIRGNEIGMVFQDALASLNPVLTIGDQIAESLRSHRILSNEGISWTEKNLIGNFFPHRSTENRYPKSWERAVELIDAVGIPDPEQRAHEYPHQFSGGMRQRAMIAMAIACHPDLLIADEPTTALDVTIQAQILNLIQGLQDEMGMGMLLITHDLGVIIEMCDRVLVMYAGEIIEKGTVENVFNHPQHPYTAGLIRSIPEIEGPKQRLQPVQGQVPDLIDMSDECHYVPRCAYAHEGCRQAHPQMYETTNDPRHKARCIMHDKNDEYDPNVISAGKKSQDGKGKQ